MRLAFDILTAGAIWVFLILGSLVVAWSYWPIGVALWFVFWSIFIVSLDRRADTK